VNAARRTSTTRFRGRLEAQLNGDGKSDIALSGDAGC
jgi:hypothetical protein